MSSPEQQRARRERIAMDEGRDIRPYRKHGGEVKAPKEYKRLKRRELGVKSREQQRIDREAKKLASKNEKASLKIHDAHVKSFKSDLNRYRRWKYANVPSYAIYHRVKRWVHKHLGDGLGSLRWSGQLGYSSKELQEHLELQFARGMNWSNKGKWHIDHIRPVASFDIDSIDSEAFRECFGLANLRPVWAKDNMRKGKKLEFLL